MALPPSWERYTTDDGKEYFHNVSTNKTQWERPSWDEAPRSSLNTSDVFTYKPSAADLEVPRATASKSQELDDLFMGVATAATGPGTSELVSLKDARGDMSSSVSSIATSAPSASLPQSQGGSGLGFAAGFAAGAAAASAASGDSQGGATSFSSWILLLAQSLFDVSTDDVVSRLKLLVPYRGQDRSTAEELRTRPDFYGPFWVATTAVLFLAATGNFARLIESTHPSHFKADYSLVPLAATLVYGGLIAVPLLARVSVFFTDEEVSNIDFKHIICVYGYGLAPAIPVSILCIIPVGFLRWLFVLAGMGLSLYFLKGNLLAEISVKVRWLQLTLIAAPIILQVLVFFVYRVRFFAGDRD
ncbi:unnamed protein product [Cladocopium goreaui]|uniref:Protein YIPF n=1 Tax=Cladocopium goreaui TaxID=2562237 RepID=A0A9P1C5P5_9DINO|nr:unnamed protein product [Cladocopium goreaui]